MVAHWVLDWAPVATAGLAAVAASASWMSVVLSRRQWLANQRPELVAQVVDNPQKQQIELHILNAGIGPAIRIRFCLVLGEQFVTGYAGPNYGGVLKHDETRVVITDLSSRTGTPYGAVVCLDATGRVHSWDLAGSHRLRRVRRVGEQATDPASALKAHYPSVELAALTKVGGRAHKKQSEGR